MRNAIEYKNRQFHKYSIWYALNASSSFETTITAPTHKFTASEHNNNNNFSEHEICFVILDCMLE